MARLYKNENGYKGEKINIKEILQKCTVYARMHSWDIEYINRDTDYELLVFKRIISQAYKNIYISSGMHGDEPAGPPTVEKLLNENVFPPHTNIWILPCLNPTGVKNHTRENINSIDINRDYRNLKTKEAKGHVEWLSKQPDFDVSICIHEDWEANGFYIYGQNLEKSNRVIEEVRKIFPIESSTKVDGLDVSGGVIDVNKIISSEEINIDTNWPEAFYLMKEKYSENYTLETSSDYTLMERVNALYTGVQSLMYAA